MPSLPPVMIATLPEKFMRWLLLPHD
jgi:hypothetical protein